MVLPGPSEAVPVIQGRPRRSALGSAQKGSQPLFQHGTAQGEFGASIFWVNAETSFADTEDLVIGWQTRRDLRRRGIVEVIEDDSK